MQEFEALFRAYTPMVYRYLLSLCGDASLAEELTGETFYRAYIHIGRFRGDCKMETWLCQIAKKGGAGFLPAPPFLHSGAQPSSSST